MLGIQSSLVGASSQIQNLLKTIEKVAQTDSTVLITGESGTGKELVARAIHEKSRRSNQPLIVVNCAAIPGDLLEAELFGHVRGAFTGATQDRQGRFEAANGGTLFLDEVGELPIHLQAKLLRVLQQQEFEPVGSSRTIKVDVRIIAATNRDLEAQVREKAFREDLYYRLNVIPITIAPLRERKSDIPILVEHFIKQFNQITGHSVETPSGVIMEALVGYDWPGNVRELENLMERLVILKGAGPVDMADLPHRIFQKATSAGAGASVSGIGSGISYPRMILPENGIDLKNVVEAFENDLVDQALARTGGNKNRASQLLMMNRTTLVEKLRKRGMITPLKQKNAARSATEHPAGATAGISANTATASSASANINNPIPPIRIPESSL
jgi:transcriptional regulator with GAF, ATPase, and Fis domain